MHILLLLSYAFSIWMIVDAYKRGAEHFWYLIIFFPLGEWIYFFLVKIHDFKNSHGFSLFGEKVKCSSCKYCQRLDNDGVLCIQSGKPYFKTFIHIGYCNKYVKK